MISVEKHKISNPSVYKFLHSRGTSCLAGLNILFSTSLSNTLNLQHHSTKCRCCIANDKYLVYLFLWFGRE